MDDMKMTISKLENEKMELLAQHRDKDNALQDL
jgi:hypothetical protein